MIRFFKVNDPLRLIGLLLVLLAIKLPLIISGLPLTAPELSWMLLGEKINEGLLIYKDIEDNTGPVMAYLCSLLYKLFGRSQTAYQLIALGLLYFQAVYFNFILNRYDVLKENNYVPALLYILWGSISIEFHTLSPSLLSLTFLVLGLRHLLSILKKGSNEEHLFLLGFNTGMASLFYMPSLVFTILFLVVFVLYTNVSVRRYGVFFFGLLFPLVMIALLFYWRGSLEKFLVDILYYSFIVKSIRYVRFGQIGLFLAPAALVVAWGVLKALSARGTVNFQQIAITIFIFFGLFGIGTIFLAFKISYSNTIILIPSITVFTYFLLTEIRRKWMYQLVSTSYFVGIVYIAFAYTWGLPGWAELDNDKLILTKSPIEATGRVMVLSDDNSYFLNNQQATRFVNWQLSKRFLGGMNDYEYVNIVYRNLSDDLPDLIIDPDNYLPAIFKRMPQIAVQYEQVEAGSYRRIKKL